MVRSTCRRCRAINWTPARFTTKIIAISSSATKELIDICGANTSARAYATRDVCL